MIIAETAAFRDYRDYYTTGAVSMRALRRLQRSQRETMPADGSRGGGRFRPSLFGHQCDRVQVLSHDAADSDYTGSWYTWMGTWMHLAFQLWLVSKYASSLNIEVPVRGRGPWAKVAGRADWVWHGDHRTAKSRGTVILAPHVGDYKTIGTMEKVEDGPVREHVDQLGLEMCAMTIDTGYLVYQQRDNGAMKSFRLDLEAADVDRLRTRVVALTKHTMNGTLPPVLPKCAARTGQVYERCAFSEACLAQAEEETA